MASFTAAYKLSLVRPSLSPSSPQHLLPSLNKSVLSFSPTPSFSSISLASTGNPRSGKLVASAAAGPKRLLGSLTSTQGLKFAVVVARFNEIVTSLLLEGALETFRRYSVKEENITLILQNANPTDNSAPGPMSHLEMKIRPKDLKYWFPACEPVMREVELI